MVYKLLSTPERSVGLDSSMLDRVAQDPILRVSHSFRHSFLQKTECKIGTLAGKHRASLEAITPDLLQRTVHQV